MSATFSQPQNRLTWRAGFRGVSRTEALDRAAANVEEIREPTIAYVDENLDRLSQLLAQFERAASDSASSPPFTALYDASNAITSTAELFGLGGLGKGAFSLCECLVYMEGNGTWHADAVQAHLDGMRIMRRQVPPISEIEQKIIVENLNTLLLFLVKRDSNNIST